MLEGDRIVLRTIKKDDIDTIFDLTRQYPDIDKLFPMSLLSELIVTKHFEPGDPGKESNACLLITLKPGDIIGSIAYFKVGWHRGTPTLLHGKPLSHVQPSSQKLALWARLSGALVKDTVTSRVWNWRTIYFAPPTGGKAT